MSTKEIINLFSKNEARENVPSTETLSELTRRFNLQYTVDEDGLSYLCRVPVLDLNKSDLPDETINNMLKEGWSLSKDRKYLQIFS